MGENNDRVLLAQVQRQYKIARQHHGEYVVLIGERVICHSHDEDKAGEAYNVACEKGLNPVFIPPKRLPPTMLPVIHGRAPLLPEVPVGAVCADCESAPATHRRPCENGEEYVCEMCFQAAFERGLPEVSRSPESDD